MNFNGKQKVSSWKRFSPRIIGIYLHYRYSKNNANNNHKTTLFMKMLGKYYDFRQRHGLNKKKPPYTFKYKKGVNNG